MEGNPGGREAAEKGYTSKQQGDACEMLVAAELTLAGVPALKVPDNWPGYDVIAHPSGRGPQQVSVKSITPSKNYTRIRFDPETCDWLAIVVLGENVRRYFIIPKDVAVHESTSPPSAQKTHHLIYSKLLREPLSCYKDNFKLCRPTA